jgi:hypothetical protein
MAIRKWLPPGIHNIGHFFIEADSFYQLITVRFTQHMVVPSVATGCCL